jgi:hypothetical protein
LMLLRAVDRNEQNLHPPTLYNQQMHRSQ